MKTTGLPSEAAFKPRRRMTTIRYREIISDGFNHAAMSTDLKLLLMLNQSLNGFSS